MPTSYSEIKTFWENNPCSGGNKKFPFEHFRGLKVLEIGCGAGNDAYNFFFAGADYTGIDLTDKAIELTKDKVRGGNVIKMNAEKLDFPDETFDLVYSFGVIHHALRRFRIMQEIHRVLNPQGKLYIMLYNRPSWRYFEIMVLRKILWKLNYYKFREIRKTLPNPTKEEWISINTDNIGCPMSKVYDKHEALLLCRHFKDIHSYTTNWGWFRIIEGEK